MKKGVAAKASVIAIGAIAVLGAGSYAAYKFLFSRPGEAAIQWIPADADLVVTLDLKPSDRQVATFQKISEALEQEGISDQIEKGMRDMFAKDPWLQPVKENLDRSFAVALWAPPEGEKEDPPRMAIMLAIKDPGQVDAAIKQGRTPAGDGTINIDGKTYAKVIDSYLVIGTRPDVLPAIESVKDGKAPSMAKQEEFVAAREALPRDANLMVFASPKLLSFMGKSMAGANGNPFAGTKWFCFGATLEPEGLQIDLKSPLDAKAVPGYAKFGSIEPISTETLKHVPSGAYGYVGYSHPSKLWEGIVDAQEAGGNAEQVEEGIAEFERETGLNFENDVLPAFEGDAIFAAYPKRTGNSPDIDLLFMIGGSGQKANALADKLRSLIESKSAESGDSPARFEQVDIAGVKVWSLDAASAEEMGKQMTAMDGKTPSVRELCYAEVDGNLLICTSKALMTRAVTECRGGSSLATDPDFASLADRKLSGSQAEYALSVKRILDTVREFAEPGMKDAPVRWQDLEAMFTPGLLIGSCVMDANTMTARMNLPLDFEKIVRVIGKSMPDEDIGANSETPSPLSVPSN